MARTRLTAIARVNIAKAIMQFLKQNPTVSLASVLSLTGQTSDAYHKSLTALWLNGSCTREDIKEDGTHRIGDLLASLAYNGEDAAALLASVAELGRAVKEATAPVPVEVPSEAATEPTEATPEVAAVGRRGR